MASYFAFYYCTKPRLELWPRLEAGLPRLKARLTSQVGLSPSRPSPSPGFQAEPGRVYHYSEGTLEADS